MNDQEFVNITSNNLLLYAMHHYYNPSCTTLEDFNKDMSHIKHLLRLLRRYKKRGILRERLILNHIILLNNVLKDGVMVKILFFKIDKELWCYLKPFLLALNLLPKQIHGVGGYTINTDEIISDMNIIKCLENLP